MNEEEYLWVARDENRDLFLFAHKPIKYNKIWYSPIDESRTLELNPASFQNVKWEDEEPLAVVLQQAIFKSK